MGETEKASGTPAGGVQGVIGQAMPENGPSGKVPTLLAQRKRKPTGSVFRPTKKAAKVKTDELPLEKTNVSSTHPTLISRYNAGRSGVNPKPAGNAQIRLCPGSGKYRQTSWEGTGTP